MWVLGFSRRTQTCEVGLNTLYTMRQTSVMRGIILVLCGMAAFSFLPEAQAAPLSPASIGFGGQTRNDNYDELVNSLCSNSNVVTTIGDKMWVPWYSSSTSCTTGDLQRGNNCNSGEAIDSTHNCMVTDEFSQVGVLVAMSKDQARMDQFYN